MDLGSRLANLSLAEIASMLDSKQQEVLLASISVAARYIQQMQAEEQLLAEEEQQFLQDEHNTHHHHHHSQQQQQQHNSNTINNSSSSIIINNNNNNIHLQDDVDDHFDEDDDDEEEDELELDEDDEHDEQQLSQHQHRQNNRNNSNNRKNSNTKLNLHLSSHQQRHDNHQEGHMNHRNNYHNNHLDSSYMSEAAPSQIKDFAEELKHRRKLIRLSQKGAAQSLRAFTNGQQPCTDAIIYHFENLQLEPDRATQLIPLLRDWLEWAEKHRLNGQQLPMLRAVTKVPRERKRKVVLFNEKAKQYLEDAFLKNNHPDRYQLDVISQELNIPTRSIRKWFTNRRQRKRFAEKFST